MLGPSLTYTYRGGWALLLEQTLRTVKPESELEGLVVGEMEDFMANITEEPYPVQLPMPPTGACDKCS